MGCTVLFDARGKIYMRGDIFWINLYCSSTNSLFFCFRDIIVILVSIGVKLVKCENTFYKVDISGKSQFNF